MSREISLKFRCVGHVSINNINSLYWKNTTVYLGLKDLTNALHWKYITVHLGLNFVTYLMWRCIVLAKPEQNSLKV